MQTFSTFVLKFAPGPQARTVRVDGDFLLHQFDEKAPEDILITYVHNTEAVKRSTRFEIISNDDEYNDEEYVYLCSLPTSGGLFHIIEQRDDEHVRLSMYP